ncbi:uncharacterized protein [Asterias amurensis]|uniref:uncharacterized protein isoform X2 n=1 Tax=Asterias amurensis TaxID=7602 RepID=UPI003AB5799C
MQSAMWKIREIQDKVTNMVMNYTDVEAKVREATNDDTWGPHGSLMAEIAKETYTYEHFPEVMAMIWKRMLHDSKKNWRRVYKSLLLLAYLILNGSERVVTSAREHLYDLRSLENYSFMDEFNRDQGQNVRQKVKDVVDFIQDDERLRIERKKARKAKDKYIGLSSENQPSKYSDRYDSEPRMPRNKMKEYDDEIDTYKSKQSRFNIGRITKDKVDDSDESPQELVEDDDFGEEDEAKPKRFEFKDEENEETFTHTTTTERRTKRIKKRSGKKVDLGAAGSYADDTKSDSNNSINTTPTTMSAFDSLIDTSPKAAGSEDVFADFTSAAANNSFSDFNPRGTASPVANSSTDFATFQSAPQNPKAQDASFGDFQSFSASISQQTSTLTSVQANTTSPQSPMQPINAPLLQPQSAPVLQPHAASLLTPAPAPLQPQQMNLMQSQPTNNVMQSPNVPLPAMQMGMSPQQPLGGVGLQQPIMGGGAGVMLQQQPQGGGMMPQGGGIMPQGGGMMPQGGAMQYNQQSLLHMQSQQAPTKYQAQQFQLPVQSFTANMGMGQPISQQYPNQQPMMSQQMYSQQNQQSNGVLASKTVSVSTSSTPQKKTLWSDVNVDIKLDNLSPGDKYRKQAQPSMNQLQQHKQPLPTSIGQPQMGNIAVGMGQMNLAQQQQQHPQQSMMGSPMMQQQQPQGMMGMPAQGMMGMQPQGMMGVQGGMGGMTPQTQQYSAYGAK